MTKRRLFLVQKIREVRNIGILISTLSTEKYMDAIERVKEMCKLRNKKSYVISVGKINVAKLANFPDVRFKLFLEFLKLWWAKHIYVYI